MAICQKCGYDNPDDFRFCGKCGVKLYEPAIYCPKCGKVFEDLNYCGVCGAKLVTEYEYEQIINGTYHSSETKDSIKKDIDELEDVAKEYYNKAAKNIDDMIDEVIDDMDPETRDAIREN